MKKFLSLVLVTITLMSLMITSASAAETLGKFDELLSASEKCLGTSSYGNATINKFPVGTYICVKSTYDYYLDVQSQRDSLKEGESSIWAPMVNEFTIPNDYTIYALRVMSYKTGACKLIYVQGVPGTKAAEHTGSLNDATPNDPQIFADVPNDAWYQPAVVYCYQNNIMNGVNSTEFKPYGELTRAMVWVMFARLDGQTNIGGSTWYEGARQWAMKVGMSDGTMPNQSVTRQQLCAMAYRYWKYKKLPEGNANAAFYDPKIELNYRVLEFAEYTDTNEISSYALEPMKWAVKAGLIEQNTGAKLTPKNVLNRAQVAYFMGSFRETWAPVM